MLPAATGFAAPVTTAPGIPAQVAAAPGIFAPAAGAPAKPGGSAGRYDLDVIFVIDNSGSMRQSDPQKLALSASNLFIDMCEGSDSRVGYVMFTNEIPAFQPLTDLQSNNESLKAAIARTQWVSNGDTDTALGLEKAYELLERDSLGGKSDRKPVVILLSDGNTDLPRGPRTKAESLAALEVMKTKFADAGVPIHTIGFNFDGSLDIEAMGEIADITGATFDEVNSADQLPGILRKIYGHLTGAESRHYQMTATGGPQSYIITPKNSSAYKVTVTISANNPIKDASITDPDGTNYDVSKQSAAVSVNEDPNRKYILFTLYRPAKGDWVLTFTGTKDDIVSIDELNVYDFDLIMDIPVVATTPPFETRISWQLQDRAGAKVTDADLIGDLLLTLYVKNITDGTEEEYFFPSGSTSEEFEFAAGDYEAYLTMFHEDFDDEKASNIRRFTVPDEPQPPAAPPHDITLMDPAINTYSVKLTTIFNPGDVLYLNDFIRYKRENEPLKVEFKNGDWEDIIKLEYDGDNEIAITALGGGQTTTEITVTCDCGEDSVTIYLEASAASGLQYIIIAAAVLLGIIAGLILLLLGKKPYLDSPMRGFAIEVRNLPEGLEYPQEAELRLEHVKGKRNLQQIINYNRQFAQEYNNSLRDITWFLMGTEFSCKRRTDLDITIPVNPRFTVQVDGHNQSRPYNGVFAGGRELRINLIQDEYYYYEIILGKNSFGADQWGGSDPWSGGADPYGRGGADQYGRGGPSPDDFDLV